MHMDNADVTNIFTLPFTYHAQYLPSSPNFATIAPFVDAALIATTIVESHAKRN
jgi:hypothetical protein